MKHIFKIALFIFIVGLVSCKSSTKKNLKNKIAIDTAQLPVHGVEIQPTQDEVDQQKQVDSLDKPGSTKAIFPGYAIFLHNFKVYNEFDRNNKLVYEVDSNELSVNHKKDLVTLMCRKDTLHITIGIYNGELDTIKIIPNNKDEKFKIDFSYQIAVYQNDDEWRSVQPNTDLKKFARWYGMTTYVAMTELPNYSFKINPDVFKNNFFRNDIRKKIPVKDTSIIYHREYEEEATLIYKGKPCSVLEEAIYYRIQRFKKDILVDTKFIRLDLPAID